ncbi:type VII secretion protein EccE, partial [Streptomyces sp. SID14478]|nr:type VII secretion protein EccE [Streptomyces sp. SID14478]
MPPGQGHPGQQAQPSSASPHLKSRSGRGGSFRAQRLVLIELAAALVVCGWVADNMVAMTATGAVAAVLLLLALVRRRGRSLPEWLGSVLALRARRRGAAST